MSIYIFSSNWCFTAQGWPYWSSESLASQDRPVPLLVTEVGCLLGMAREQILGLIEDGGPPKKRIFSKRDDDKTTGVWAVPRIFRQSHFNSVCLFFRKDWYRKTMVLTIRGWGRFMHLDCWLQSTSEHVGRATLQINKMGGIHPQHPMVDDHWIIFFTTTVTVKWGIPYPILSYPTHCPIFGSSCWIVLDLHSWFSTLLDFRCFHWLKISQAQVQGGELEVYPRRVVSEMQKGISPIEYGCFYCKEPLWLM